MYLRKIFCIFVVVIANVMVLLPSNSSAEEIAVNPELYGSWNALNLEQNGLKANLILIIEEEQVIAHNTCSFRGYSVVAQTSSPAVITSNEIRILRSNMAMEEYSPGFLQCKASIKAANMKYQLRNGKLFLDVPEERETLELSRADGQSQATVKAKGPQKREITKRPSKRTIKLLRQTPVTLLLTTIAVLPTRKPDSMNKPLMTVTKFYSLIPSIQIAFTLAECHTGI